MRKLLVLAAALAAACSPDVIDQPYEKLSIALRGPRVTAGSAGDPFTTAKTLEATLRFYEDAAATKPYGADLDRTTLAEEVKDFKPEVTVTGLDPASKSLDVFATAPFALPRLADTQGSIFVRTEVVGRNAAGDVVARGRCDVTELKKDTKGTKTCKAFFGLVGQWNPIDPPLKARRRFAAAASGAKVAVVGGVAADPLIAIAPLGAAEIYDHVEGTWSEKPTPTPRYDLRATSTATGQVVFTGGKLSETSYSSAIEYFDGSTFKAGSSPLGSLRARHTTALVGGNTVLVVGGRSNEELSVRTPEFVKLEGASFKASSLNTLMISSQRDDACAAQLAENVVVVCGGGPKECESFDGSTFKRLGDVSFASGLGAVRCAVAGDTAVFVGGTPAGEERKFLLVRKDAVEEVLHTDGALALVDHAMAAANGKVVVAGGHPESSRSPLKATFLIDAEGNVTQAGDLTSARAEFQMVGLPDGTVLALGGVGVVTPTAEIFVVP